jgi:hypothetical protein
VKGVVIKPPAIGKTCEGFFITSKPVVVFITSSPAKSAELGFIKLRIAEACLASTETIFPANNR